MSDVTIAFEDSDCTCSGTAGVRWTGMILICARDTDLFSGLNQMTTSAEVGLRSTVSDHIHPTEREKRFRKVTQTSSREGTADENGVS